MLFIAYFISWPLVTYPSDHKLKALHAEWPQIHVLSIRLFTTAYSIPIVYIFHLGHGKSKNNDRIGFGGRMMAMSGGGAQDAMGGIVGCDAHGIRWG